MSGVILLLIISLFNVFCFVVYNLMLHLWLYLVLLVSCHLSVFLCGFFIFYFFDITFFFDICVFFSIMNDVIFIYPLYHFVLFVAILTLISLSVHTKACEQHCG